MLSFNNLKKSFWITLGFIITLKFQLEETKASIYYLENVDRDYPDIFKTLKHSLPTVTFLKVSHSLQVSILVHLLFSAEMILWMSPDRLCGGVILLQFIFGVIFPNKVSAIIWLPMVSFFPVLCKYILKSEDNLCNVVLIKYVLFISKCFRNIRAKCKVNDPKAHWNQWETFH